ncbi:MAG: hypothetical protein ACRERU_03065 [Methylococcales bacterium]
METTYAIFRPDKTNLGIEWKMKFRDPLDRRVKATITIACGVGVGSSALCDTLDFTFRPRAIPSGELTVGWDFVNNSFTHSLFTPGIPFTIVDTSLGDLELNLALNIPDKTLTLDFEFTSAGNILQTTIGINQLTVPDDLQRYITLLQ